MSSQRKKISLKRITRRSTLGVLGIGIPSGIWAAGIEPNLLSITRKELTLPRWPKALDGFRVAQLTDIHFRPGTDDGMIAKLHEALGEEKPDLITLTGDFVINDPSSLPELCRELKGISAPHGVIASPGNHDRWHCSTFNLRKEIEGTGMTYLQNQSTKLHIKGENIFVNGLDSIWGGQPLPGRAWQGHKKDEPVIALVHEPDPFDELHLSRPLDLQLSGHTHGGQCRVPFFNYAPAKVKFGRKFIYGHFQKGDAQLFVGRGLGTVGIRVRFACPPELVILTLRSS
ncbi:MAG: putative MPP superfamily phosphohydrolase [Akkermansiaceae bacterium]|jgi:predicted MPP superfamily phosphohydrolase